MEEKAEWHLLHGKEQAGPYPLSKMREAVAQNDLTRTTNVWRHGWSEWRLAGSVPELFESEPADASQSTAPDETTGSAAGVEAQPQQPAFTEQQPTENYILRHWRGDLSLPMSFWVNGVVVGIGLQMFASAPVAATIEPIVQQIERGGSGVAQLFVGIAVALITVTIGIAVMIWQCVGIWRSASKHAARGGSPAWAVLAKVAIVLGLLVLVLGIFAVIALIFTTTR